MNNKDNKIVTVNFGPEGQFEYVDVRVSRYVGGNGYERWPSSEEILEVGQRLADRILLLRRRIAADLRCLSHIKYELGRLTGVSSVEVDKDLDRFTTILYNKQWAASRIRLAVVPDTPSQSYTIDPFVGWACDLEADYTGDAEVDRLIDKYRYDIIWRRGYLAGS